MIEYAVKTHMNTKRPRKRGAVCMFMPHVFCIQSFFAKMLAGFYKDISNKVTNRYVAVTL